VTASTVDHASDLLKVVSLPWAVLTGLAMRYSFEWSSQDKEFDTLRSWLALGLAGASLAMSCVLAALFGVVAIKSFVNHGNVQPVLVVFDLLTTAILAAVGVSIYAVVRAARHLKDIREPACP